MTNSSIFHPRGFRPWRPAESHIHPAANGSERIVVCSVILICFNFLETLNKADDIRGWFKSDAVRVSEREKGGETKPLVDMIVLEVWKTHTNTSEQKSKKHTSSLGLKLACVWLAVQRIWPLSSPQWQIWTCAPRNDKRQSERTSASNCGL